MIPVLIFYLIRRYKSSLIHATTVAGHAVKKSFKIVLVLALFTLIAVFAFSQEKKLEYQVKRKGDVVGTVLFTQSSSGSKTTLKMQSEVKTRFVFLFTAKAQEEAIYENGVMTWSSIYRKFNGSEKVNKKTQAAGDAYVICKNNKVEVSTNYPVRNNMLSLYMSEPVTYSKVYSDNFQQFLAIEKLGPQHYKIELPDGNYNEYYYANGLCSKIEIHHSMYSATVELKK